MQELSFFIRQIKESGLDVEENKPVLIFYGGEPLVNFKVLEYTATKVNELRNTEKCMRNIEMSIVTNGLLLDELRIKRLHELGVAIAISIDGFTEEANSMRVDVAGKPVFSRILDTLDLCKRLGVDVSLSVTLSEETIKNTKDILNLVDTYGVKAFGFNIMMSSDTFVLPQSYNEAAAQFIIDEFVELRERGIYEDRIMRKLKSFSNAQVYFSDCAATTGGQIVIAPNGQVGICHGCLHDKQYFVAHIDDDSFVAPRDANFLGYLFFHRSIPTLSGGELQRLRMVQVLNTQLANLLLVLDEPLAGLSGNEKKAVFQSVIDLAKKHTVVVVDHSDIFVNSSKRIIALGEKGGINGGFLIDAEKYIAEQSVKNKIKIAPVRKLTHVIIKNSVYSYNGVNISIGEHCMNLITGRSGIGKSTLLREYLPQYYEHYLYINQKPLLGNKNSSVATTLDIFTRISNLFASKHKKDRRFFSNQTGCEGMCEVCMGAGYIEYGSGYDSKIQLICKDCGGTGFNKKLQKYKLYNKSIFDVWNMTIDEGIIYFNKIDKKITEVLSEAASLLLGHLKIGQPISTLSGGENIRVKLLKVSKATAKALGIDEPFKGLANTEIYCVAQYLDKLRSSNKTIIVVDHSDVIEQYFAKHIELTCNNNILESIDTD